eukprot:4541934-Prymnesium_polylepis.1
MLDDRHEETILVRLVLRAGNVHLWPHLNLVEPGLAKSVKHHVHAVDGRALANARPCVALCLGLAALETKALAERAPHYVVALLRGALATSAEGERSFQRAQAPGRPGTVASLVAIHCRVGHVCFFVIPAVASLSIRRRRKEDERLRVEPELWLSVSLRCHSRGQEKRVPAKVPLERSDRERRCNVRLHEHPTLSEKLHAPLHLAEGHDANASALAAAWYLEQPPRRRAAIVLPFEATPLRGELKGTREPCKS